MDLELADAPQAVSPGIQNQQQLQDEIQQLRLQNAQLQNAIHQQSIHQGQRERLIVDTAKQHHDRTLSQARGYGEAMAKAAAQNVTEAITQSMTDRANRRVETVQQRATAVIQEKDQQMQMAQSQIQQSQ